MSVIRRVKRVTSGLDGENGIRFTGRGVLFAISASR